MLKNTTFPQYELEMISLEQLVLKDHLVRKVANAIDFKCNGLTNCNKPKTVFDKLSQNGEQQNG